jgi:hypothetical protein
MRQLHAGAARSVITPTIGGWQHGNVHDDLYSKALVLASGDATIAFAVCDLPVIAKRDADRAKEIAEKLTGIPATNIMVAATHTHYAPFDASDAPHYQAYFEWVAGRVADSIMMAKRQLRPALISYGSGMVPGEVFHRRYWMKDGTVLMNPVGSEYRDPATGEVRQHTKEEIVRPAGTVDPEVGALFLLDEARHPIAVLANYALHYVNAPDYSEISANYFGAFERALQRMSQSNLVGIMLNGCCGDVNNEDHLGEQDPYPYDYYRVDRVADVVACEVYQLWRSVRYSRWTGDVGISAASEAWEYRTGSVTPEEVAEAEAFLKDRKPPGWGKVDWLDWVKAWRSLRLSKMGSSQISQVQAFRIGDLAIAALPTEVFVEIGLDIKRRSPFKQTIVGELANDWFGYLPTDAGFEQGGYETLASRCAPGTGQSLADCAVRLLRKVAS